MTKIFFFCFSLTTSPLLIIAHQSAVKGGLNITLFNPNSCMALLYLRFSVFWLRTTNLILLLCWSKSSFAYGDIYMLNSSVICDACASSCETSQVEQILIGDCQRGCRLFDTLFIQNSIFIQFDEMIALPNCQQSCSEAYGSAISAVKACFDGCTNAQQEYHKRSLLLVQYIRELHRNLTFFDWFPKPSKAIGDFESVLKSGKMVRNSNENIPNFTPLYVDKSQLTLAANNQQPTVDNQSTWRGTTKQTTTIPNWMIHSALAIFVVGVIMVLVVCCYCCIFGKYHINKYMPSRSKSIDSDLPPSYEQLMRNAV